MSETAKYRQLTTKYCYRPDGQPGCGIDLASQGDPVVPWAWQLDLPPGQFEYYNGGHKPIGPLQLYGDAFQKFCEDASLDFVYTSHLLEDRAQVEWPAIFRLWVSALRPGGLLIVLVPEVGRWKAALDRGQPPNCSHSAPEPSLGDMSRVAAEIGLTVVEERFTDLSPEDYTILGVFRKP